MHTAILPYISIVIATVTVVHKAVQNWGHYKSSRHNFYSENFIPMERQTQAPVSALFPMPMR